MTDQPVQRNAGLDRVKTLAIGAVVAYHGFTASVNTAAGLAERVNYFVYSAMCLGVPLFLLVNGYLLFSKPLDVKKHAAKTVRLVVLAVFWQAVTVLALMPAKGEWLSPGELAAAVFYGRAGWTDHFWFLGALAICYVFFPAAKAAFDHARGGFWFFLGATALLTFGNTALNMAANVLLVLARGTGIETENFFQMFNAYAGTYGFAVGYFLLGGALVALRERVVRTPAALLASVIVISVLGQGVYGLMQSAWRGATWDSVFFGYDTIFALMGALCVFALGQKSKPSGRARLSAQIGAMTLPMYLVQGIVIPWLLPRVRMWSASENLLFSLAFAAVVFALCAVIAGLMKRVPGIRALVKL